MGRADRGASIAPTALWCPYGSRPTAGAPPPPLPRRSCQDSSLANSPRGERLRSEGTNNALRRTERALRSVLVVVCVVMNVIEAPVHPRFTVPRRGALQPRQGAPTASSEIFGNVVFGCRGEVKRGEEGASKVSSGCPRVRSTTTCDLIMESPASAFLALRNRPSRAVPPYAYARRPPPEVPPVPHHRIALCIRSARSFFFSLFSTLPRSSRPPALDDHDCLPPRPLPPPRPHLLGIASAPAASTSFSSFFIPNNKEIPFNRVHRTRVSRGGEAIMKKKPLSLPSRNEEPP